MSEFGLLRDLVLIFAVALVVVAILRRVGVPTIAGFILAGVLIGPRALGLIEDVHQVELLAEIGVVLLLFGIGLELSLDKVRRLWQPVLVGGALQVGATILATWGLAVAFGIGHAEAVFLGFLVAVSSTAIVLRGLRARGELDAPHGRLALGILVFQDLGVIPMMLAVPLLTGEEGGGWRPFLTLARTALLLALVFVAARLVVPRLLHLAARTRQRDLFVLAVILASLGAAWVFASAGVSLALGAFLAGLVVAGSDYRHQALSDLIPFREVLTSLFFVSIGMLLDPVALSADPGPALLLFAAIFLGKFLIVFLAGVTMRLPLRVCILAGMGLAQVGEFSFVLMHAPGADALVPASLAESLPAAVILSMLVTPLVLAAAPHVAAGVGRIRPLTRLMQVRTPEDSPGLERHLHDHVIIAGYGLAGMELARSLHDLGKRYVIADLNPDNVRSAVQELEPAYFGDVTSPEVLEHLGIARASCLAVAINDPDAAARAVRAARRLAPDLYILARGPFIADVPRLLEAGANEVVAAELEAAVELTRRMLARIGVPDAGIREEVERIQEEAEQIRED